MHEKNGFLQWKPACIPLRARHISKWLRQGVRNFQSPRRLCRCKDRLITNDLLEKWYDYSNEAEEAALREWCADNGIELAECEK